MPKSVLRYDVDNDLTSVWYFVFTLSCFPNKKTNRRRRVKQCIFSLLFQYEILAKLVTLNQDCGNIKNKEKYTIYEMPLLHQKESVQTTPTKNRRKEQLFDPPRCYFTHAFAPYSSVIKNFGLL